MDLNLASFTSADAERYVAEYRAKLDERRRADLAALPIASGVLVVREHAPFRRHRKNPCWCLEVSRCPHCGRPHCTTITGARRPRHAKLAAARTGEHVGRCPNTSWAPYRVTAVVERTDQ